MVAPGVGLPWRGTHRQGNILVHAPKVQYERARRLSCDGPVGRRVVLVSCPLALGRSYTSNKTQMS